MSQAPTSARRAGGPRGRTVSGTVAEAGQIGRRFRRIRIEGGDVSRLDWIPGQQVRVHVADMRDPRSWLHPKDMLRTYSVWNFDGGIDLRVLDHSAGSADPPGPGVRWAREARPGDRVTFNRPEGTFTLRDGPYHVLAGDETASVAFGAMLGALPATSPAFGVIEVDSPEDRLPLGREVSWLYRHGAPAASSRVLARGLAGLDLPDEPGVAYLAGEARTVQMLRDHLVRDRGWPRRSIRTKPFWSPGRRGMD